MDNVYQTHKHVWKLNQAELKTASYCFWVSASHDVCDAAQLGVDVLVDEAVPLAEGVQGSQHGHNLLRQRAAVSGCEGGLGAGLPATQ